MNNDTQAMLARIAALFGLTDIPPLWPDAARLGIAEVPQETLAGVVETCEWLGFPGEMLACLQDAARYFFSFAEGRLAVSLMQRLIADLPFDTDIPDAALSMPSPGASGCCGLFYAVVLLTRVPALREYHRSLGIPAEQTRDLLRDIELWITDHRRRFNQWGFTKALWLRHHFHGRLFQFGRLQYEPTRFSWPFRVYRRREDRATVVFVDRALPFRSDGQFADADRSSHFPPAAIPGNAGLTTFAETDDTIAGHRVTEQGVIEREPLVLEKKHWVPTLTDDSPVLAVHIPASGRLKPDEVQRSFAEAAQFFAQNYPDTRFAGFTCDSWVLDPQLAEFLPHDSNLIQFQRRFHRLPMQGANDNQHLERVFDQPPTDVACVPQDSTLQRAIAAHIRAGNGWRMTAGVIVGGLAGTQ